LKRRFRRNGDWGGTGTESLRKPVIRNPDYPGFGRSDAPPATQFAYTFDHLAQLIGDFTRLGLRRFSLLQQDYGGPIGMRLTLSQPDSIEAP